MFDVFGQFAVGGLTRGAVYALVALGFAITFRSSGIVNFAQGEFVMMGGLVAAGLTSIWGVPLAISVAIAFLVTMAVGLVMGLGLMQLEDASEFRLILITLAAAIAMQAVALIVFGTDPFRFNSILLAERLSLGGVTITVHSVFVIVVAIALAAGLALYLKRTRWGRAMVATSFDSEAAASVGVNVRSIIGLSFVLSAALGAVGGVILTPLTATSYQVGFAMSLKGFAAAVLGGMGNLTGAVIGGFAIGMVEALGAGYVSSGYKDAIALAVLVVVLLTRPQGIFGRAIRTA